MPLSACSASCLPGFELRTTIVDFTAVTHVVTRRQSPDSGGHNTAPCPPAAQSVVGGVDPRTNGEQRAAGTTRCRAGRQDVASRQAAPRLLRYAPALVVTRRNLLTHRVFIAGSVLPATSRPIRENTSCPEVNPHILCSPFIRGFSQPLTHNPPPHPCGTAPLRPSAARPSPSATAASGGASGSARRGPRTRCGCAAPRSC